MKITYHIVQHDEGWAYKLGEVFSETFATHDAALKAANAAAAEQEVDEVEVVSDRDGKRGRKAKLTTEDDLDEALIETFPASDPVSLAQPAPSHDKDR